MQNIEYIQSIIEIVNNKNYLLDIGKTLFATFIGAGLAFISNLYLKKREQDKINICSINATISILGHQFSLLKQYKKEKILPNEKMLFLITPCLEYKLDYLAVDFKSLSFLFSYDKKIYPDIILQEKRFRNLIQLINYRSQFINNPKIQENIEKFCETQKRTKGDIQELKNILGLKNFSIIDDLSKDIYNTINELLTNTTECKNELMKIGIKIYGNKKIIKTLFQNSNFD